LPQPTISVALAGKNVVLSWPTNVFQNFKLQSSPVIGPSATWSNTAYPLITNNGMLQVTVPATNPVTFYRLKL
jgi:hypothetical protein